MTALITLTTDFGLRDPYVAEMKAVILGITRAVQLVDVTHEVAPHDVAEAALALEAAAPHFPAGTVHVAVVDPGVGTPRRGLAVAALGQVFIGPDNGLFTPFFRGPWAAFALASAEHRRPAVSPTFHGRDVFAPAAAHVAVGLAPERLGPSVGDPVRLPWPEPGDGPRGLTGSVLHVDRFGNLITSIRSSALAGVGPEVRVMVGGRSLRLVGTYGDLPPGGIGALVGSADRLEIAVREGSAAARLRARPGTRVVVSRVVSRRSRTAPTGSRRSS